MLGLPYGRIAVIHSVESNVVKLQLGKQLCSIRHADRNSPEPTRFPSSCELVLNTPMSVAICWSEKPMGKMSGSRHDELIVHVLGESLLCREVRALRRAPRCPSTIDYGNFFSRPTSERQETLFESYGFVCTCEACVSLADPTRAVRCLSGKCPQGVMLPCPVRAIAASSNIGPNRLQFEWRCQTCGKVADAAEHTRMLVAE
ncbi:hypothetical protein PRNP1_012264 [Phytophthora ramorum]